MVDKVDSEGGHPEVTVVRKDGHEMFEITFGDAVAAKPPPLLRRQAAEATAAASAKSEPTAAASAKSKKHVSKQKQKPALTTTKRPPTKEPSSTVSPAQKPKKKKSLLGDIRTMIGGRSGQQQHHNNNKSNQQQQFKKTEKKRPTDSQRDVESQKPTGQVGIEEGAAAERVKKKSFNFKHRIDWRRKKSKGRKRLVVDVVDRKSRFGPEMTHNLLRYGYFQADITSGGVVS